VQTDIAATKREEVDYTDGVIIEKL